MRHLMGLLAVLFLLPMAHAVAEEEPKELCIITIKPAADWGSVLVRADEVYNTTRKDQLARSVDADSDGRISSEEVRRYENGTRQTYNDPTWLGEKNLQLDERWPSRATIHTDLTGFEGPVNDRARWLITDVREYEFQGSSSPTGGDDTHVVEGGEKLQEDPTVAIEVVLFLAPQDWVVWAINGTQYGEAQVSLQPFSTKQYYYIEYRPAEAVPHGSEIPSLGALLPLAFAVALWRGKGSNLSP